ncbi:CD3337/EF1877 family mobilome membrane protein [Bacillus sp. FSL K6-2944]|uniref:CD3337/EF1877 family mobilome membrane protein n=1 Tax=Bacillus sp. FSL K6-2944 TaxID=2921486 RepID=UPI0030F5CD53
MKKQSRFLRILLIFAICFISLNISDVSAESPNVMDELTPKSDLPETSAPIVKYNEYPIDHYELDVYIDKEKKEEGFLDKINIFKLDEKVYSNIQTMQYEILKGIWYAYLVTVNFGIYLMEQAFTFDLVGSTLEYVSVFISQIGGKSGVGQFLSFMLILTAGWLVYSFAKREIRNTFTSLIVAALLSAFFTVYVQNSDSVIRELNDTANTISNTILSSSTYSLDESAAKSERTPTNNEILRESQYKDAQSAKYGLSRIRNLMHDLLIVKPYLMLEFGTTNLAVIGGAKNKNEYNSQNIDAGKEKVKSLLKEKPNSNDRTDFVEKNVKDSLFSPENTSQRIVLAFLVWIPAIVILVMVGYLSVLTQIFGIAFLITAVMGVFILLLGIFPAWRGYVKQWGGKLLAFLSMRVVYTFLLILMFSFTNIAYKVAEGNFWSYGQTVIAILIIYATAFFLQKKLFGYKLYRKHKDQAKSFIRERVDEIRGKRRQEEQQHGYSPGTYSPAYANSTGGWNGAQSPRVANAHDQRRISRVQDLMQKQNQNSKVAPLKRNKNNTSTSNDQTSRNPLLLKNKKHEMSNTPIKKEEQREFSNNPQDTSNTDTNQIQKKQQRHLSQENAPLKKQPKPPGNYRQDENDSSSNQVANQLQKKQQGHLSQENAPLKKQPKPPGHYHQDENDSSSNQVTNQLQKKQSESRNEDEKRINRSNVIKLTQNQDTTLEDSKIDRSREIEKMRKQSNEDSKADDQ